MAAKKHTRNSYQSVIIKNNPTKFKNGRQKLTKLLQHYCYLKSHNSPLVLLLNLVIDIYK